jgi:hypothetical protein
MTLPGGFHAGIMTGFTINEAVNCSDRKIWTEEAIKIYKENWCKYKEKQSTCPNFTHETLKDWLMAHGVDENRIK